jgi:copper(I)-binding protein
VVKNWLKTCVACSSIAVIGACAREENPAPPSAQLTVRDAWARPADSGATTAMYFLLQNAGRTADTLTGVSSTDAEDAQMHVSTQHDGMMHMSEVTALPVPAEDSVSFRPLGAHVMLMRVRNPLAAGDSVTATLSFVSGATLTVTAGVRQP